MQYNVSFLDQTTNDLMAVMALSSLSQRSLRLLSDASSCVTHWFNVDDYVTPLVQRLAKAPHWHIHRPHRGGFCRSSVSLPKISHTDESHYIQAYRADDTNEQCLGS